MDNFLRYFYQDIGRVFRAFFEIIGSFFNFLNYLLNFPMRMEIIKAYESEFGTMDWIMARPALSPRPARPTTCVSKSKVVSPAR